MLSLIRIGSSARMFWRVCGYMRPGDWRRAVLDAAGSSRAALIGVSEGGPMSLLYAATYPERTSALVLYGSYARRAWAADHPFGVTSERMQGILETFEKDWGTSVAMEIWSPSMLGDRLQAVA